jgi:hypothetical protein
VALLACVLLSEPASAAEPDDGSHPCDSTACGGTQEDVIVIAALSGLAAGGVFARALWGPQ